ncbi:hypothetical protein HHI36_014538 [Cryptolaemus montrouzieri]|uniref:Secreted protein n=1 Tax=Cryptolaemus montrouzieri TaxID=559131 RepID=A0ABD2N3B5_9CUCU
MVMITTVVAAIGGTLILMGCCYCVYVNTGPGTGSVHKNGEDFNNNNNNNRRRWSRRGSHSWDYATSREREIEKERDPYGRGQPAHDCKRDHHLP